MRKYSDEELTDWMPCLTKPVRKGMYEVFTPIGGRRMRLFDGKNWIGKDGTIPSYRALEASQWRGIKK